MRLGYHSITWVGVTGAASGVTSVKDLVYRVPGDMRRAVREISAAGYRVSRCSTGTCASSPSSSTMARPRFPDCSTRPGCRWSGSTPARTSSIRKSCSTSCTGCAEPLRTPPVRGRPAGGRSRRVRTGSSTATREVVAQVLPDRQVGQDRDVQPGQQRRRTHARALQHAAVWIAPAVSTTSQAPITVPSVSSTPVAVVPSKVTRRTCRSPRTVRSGRPRVGARWVVAVDIRVVPTRFTAADPTPSASGALRSGWSLAPSARQVCTNAACSGAYSCSSARDREPRSSTCPQPTNNCSRPPRRSTRAAQDNVDRYLHDFETTG